MSSVQKALSCVSVFSLVAFVNATPAEAAFSPYLYDNGREGVRQENAPDDEIHGFSGTTVSLDACAGDLHEQDCRIVKDMTDATMRQFGFVNIYEDGHKACFTGVGAKVGNDYYLRAFSKVACGMTAVKDGLNRIEDIVNAFGIKEAPGYMMITQPFAPDDNEYEGSVGRFVFVGEGADKFRVHIDCQSPVASGGQILVPDCE